MSLGLLAICGAGCEGVASGSAPVARASLAVLAQEAPAAAASTAPEASPAGAGLPSEDEPRRVPREVPRVYARTRHVWIRPEPNTRSEWIGYLWWGDSVVLKDPKPFPERGCAAWVAVEPRGYVCAEGPRATLNPDDPVVAGVYPYAHDSEAAVPHPHYGESLTAERYFALPTEQEQRAREWDYRAQMERIARARTGLEVAPELAGIDLTPVPETAVSLPKLPETLQLPHTRLIVHSSIAWTREVRHTNRNWLLTDDLTWVPKDRIRPFEPVTFHGIQLGAEARLPLAMFREMDRPSYRREADGSFTPDGKQFARLSSVELTGRSEPFSSYVFHETVVGNWVREDEAVLPKVAATNPWAEAMDSPRASGDGERHTWIEVSIRQGWLIAYEGTRPVYVTLISPGRGGPPHGSRPPLETASTPTGRFTINGKFATSTMIAPNEVAHSGVAWSQNFQGPYSIHTAYWHNAWGEPHSGGCINVSPLDGKWLFDFTEPRLPPGWHGIRWDSKQGPATVLIIHP